MMLCKKTSIKNLLLNYFVTVEEGFLSDKVARARPLFTPKYFVYFPQKTYIGRHEYFDKI